MRRVKKLISIFALLVVAATTNETVTLKARDGKIDGTAKYQPDIDDIGAWMNPATKVSWDFELPKAGTYRVIVVYGCINASAGTTFDVLVGNQKANGVVTGTGDWARHKEFDLGPVILRKAGAMKLEVVPRQKPQGALAVMNLQAVKLVRDES